MIKFVTALFECGWCLKQAMGRTPREDEHHHGDFQYPPEGWQYVYANESSWKTRKEGTCRLTLCMGQMDVMCEECHNVRLLGMAIKQNLYYFENLAPVERHSAYSVRPEFYGVTTLVKA